MEIVTTRLAFQNRLAPTLSIAERRARARGFQAATSDLIGKTRRHAINRREHPVSIQNLCFE
jgi:hypothetical protein